MNYPKQILTFRQPQRNAPSPDTDMIEIDGESDTDTELLENNNQDQPQQQQSVLSGSGNATIGTELTNPFTFGIGLRDFIPEIEILPYVPIVQHEGKKTSVTILADLGKEFNIKPEYKFEDLTPDELEGPVTYRVTVTAGLRTGSGCGATRMEAMCEGAEDCLKNLKTYNPSFKFNIDFKKFTKTDPEKDILFVLKRTCKEFGFVPPEYKCQPAGLGQFSFSCVVGNNITEGVADKKRVAQRKAALNMYENIRTIYNSGKIV